MLLLEEGAYEKASPKKNSILLFDRKIIAAPIELVILEDEEEKDYEAIKLYIEQHKKIFRYLYSKYANSGASQKRISSFDSLKEKLDTINMAEIIKMLKDHNVTLRMISHSEVFYIKITHNSLLLF